jgi:hypothetical protein
VKEFEMARKSGKTSDLNQDVNTVAGREQDTLLGTHGNLESSYTGRQTAVGLFDVRDDAEKAIRDLKAAGFTGDQIGVAMRDRDAQGKLAESTGTNAAEGAVTGAVGGGILGGLAGLLIGIGALVIPGIGPVIAGGALATAFGTTVGTAVAGAGIGAAAGGIVGALVGMGVPEEEARYFESGFRSGRILVSVNAQGRVMEALDILERNGADIGDGANQDTSHTHHDDDRDQDMSGPYEDPRLRGDASNTPVV